MKTLLYVAPFFGVPPATGAELRAVHLAEQLSVSWKVTVLARKNGSESGLVTWAKQNNIQIEWLDCAWTPHAKSDFSRIFAARPPGFSAIDPGCMAACIRALEASHGGFDLIFLATQLAGQVLLERNWKKGAVLDLYDLNSSLARQRVDETPVIYPYHWLFRLEAFRIAGRERRILEKASLCLLPSNEELRAAQKMFVETDFAMIPNGVSLPESQHEKRSNFQIMMIGSMHHQPNLEGFTWFYEQVWPNVLCANSQARLCLVGSGQDVLSSKIKSDPSITLTGQVPDPGPYYGNSCCAVIPILRGGGTRLKLLEAMAWGLPVVTTSAGCAGVEHQDTVLLADQPAVFAGCILEILRDPGRFAECTRKARQVVEDHYTWDRIGESLRVQLDLLMIPT